MKAEADDSNITDSAHCRKKEHMLHYCIGNREGQGIFQEKSQTADDSTKQIVLAMMATIIVQHQPKMYH